MVNACIYIGPLSKALYKALLIHPFTHTLTHQRQLAAMRGTKQLVRSNSGLGVLTPAILSCITKH